MVKAALFANNDSNSVHLLLLIILLCRCDVTKEGDWQDLWTHAENVLEGKVSILVNNAGIKPDLGWKPCVDVMLMGVGYGTFLALEKMGISKVILSRLEAPEATRLWMGNMAIRVVEFLSGGYKIRKIFA